MTYRVTSYVLVCRYLNITIEYAYETQGKIERSHRKLRNKVHYDMVKLKSKGINWVEDLPNYMRVLNELTRE